MNSDELTRMLDRERIADVVRRYAHAFDRRNWPLVRSYFTDDCVIEGSVDTLPIDQALARSERLSALYASTFHFVGNQVADVEGDRGYVESYLVAYHWKAAPPGTEHPENLIGGARYHDTLIRQGDRWLIQHRRVSRDWGMGPPPAEMREAAERRKAGSVT